MSTYDVLTDLRASASQAVGTENGASKDVGPGGDKPIRAVCLVTANAGTITLKLQQSADGSTWYDVPGSNFLDPADGAVMDGTGKFEVFVKITQRYVRTVSVVATGAVTWECFLTK
jgi:hypothetical protein